MNLAEAKEKFYPEYKYALVDVKSNKPHSLMLIEKQPKKKDVIYGNVMVLC